jgi:hypothetical protein
MAYLAYRLGLWLDAEYDAASPAKADWITSGASPPS